MAPVCQKDGAGAWQTISGRDVVSILIRERLTMINDARVIGATSDCSARNIAGASSKNTRALLLKLLEAEECGMLIGCAVIGINRPTDNAIGDVGAKVFLTDAARNCPELIVDGAAEITKLAYACEAAVV